MDESGSPPFRSLCAGQLFPLPADPNGLSQPLGVAYSSADSAFAVLYAGSSELGVLRVTAVNGSCSKNIIGPLSFPGLTTTTGAVTGIVSA